MKTLWPAALIAAVWMTGCDEAAKETAGPPPAVPVKIAPVMQRDVPDVIENIGQTRGSVEVEIRARVEGFLDSVRFEEGRPVKKGDLLYEIDPKPFTAALNRAKGQQASTEADLARARQDVARYKPLVEANAISREEYETAVALEKAAVARVDSAKAMVESAELDLSYTKITAPMDAVVGKTEVKAGALVGRGQSTLLTTVSTNDPINCRFALSERDYLTVARQAKTTGEQKKPFEFEMILSDGSVHPHKGKLIFLDRLVDPTTGTILVEVTFPNPEQIVRPGQFARIRVPISMRKGAFLVPQRAVSELQATYSVGVVGSDSKVEMRSVKMGPRLGALWVVESGLHAGDSRRRSPQGKIRQGRDGRVELQHFVQADDHSVRGADRASIEELPAAIVLVVADPQDRPTLFNDRPQRDHRHVRRIGKWPVCGHRQQPFLYI